MKKITAQFSPDKGAQYHRNLHLTLCATIKKRNGDDLQQD